MAEQASDQPFDLKFKLLTSDGWDDLGLGNAEIKHAHPAQTPDGKWHVDLEFTELGYTKFAYLTSQLIGYQVGVFVNGSPVYGTTNTHGIPVMQPARMEIPGYFTKYQAVDLANHINMEKAHKPASANETKTISRGLESPMRSLSHDDILHGESQLKQMLLDRKQMSSFVVQGDSVWSWTVRQFAGEGTGIRIFWGGDLSKNTPSKFDSEVTCSSPAGPIYVKVRSHNAAGVPIDGEMLWTRVVYELFNARGVVNSPKINADAFEGRLSRTGYIERITKFEYEALRDTKKFYLEVWRPHAQKSHLTVTESYWRTTLPDSYEKWIAEVLQGGNYAEIYGKRYDRIIGGR